MPFGKACCFGWKNETPSGSPSTSEYLVLLYGREDRPHLHGARNFGSSALFFPCRPKESVGFPPGDQIRYFLV